jgi:hypothetical protein
MNTKFNVYIYMLFLFPLLYYNYSFIYLYKGYASYIHISRGCVKHKRLRTTALDSAATVILRHIHGLEFRANTFPECIYACSVGMNVTRGTICFVGLDPIFSGTRIPKWAGGRRPAEP